jgi:hypothetical protein
MRPNGIKIVALLLAIVALSSAGRMLAAQDGDSAKMRADMVNRERTRVKLKQAAKSPQFQAAVKQVSTATGVQPQPLETEAEGHDTGGVEFAPIKHAKADELLNGPLRKQLLTQGAFLFRSDNGHGLKFENDELPDTIALLPTKDKYDVLAAVETEGPNSEKYNADVIAFLRELEKTQPFELTEAGTDFLAGRFTTPVQDVAGLAKKLEEFCPDVEQEAQVKALKKGQLFLWWD